ncbi:MAG TPA: cyanophycin synthetase [Candidatus Polarisedimenticolia bacterium]|nr:cyanophycin synthetase [Candidatus Polarisedimenticolia bacterium]
MRIVRQRFMAGPNVHHHQPVLLTELEMGPLGGRESRDVSGFNQALVSLLPGLREHTCAAGAPGGFVSRLEEGTYFGHVVEHVALELSARAGIGVRYGKTLFLREPFTYLVVVRCLNEAGMRRIIRAAVELTRCLLAGAPFPIEPAIEEARRLAAGTSLGISGASIVEAALRRGIPARRVEDGSSLVQLGLGVRRRLVAAAFTDGTGGLGAEIAADKSRAKHLLRDAFLPVPEGEVVATGEDAVAAAAEIGGAVVVKPLEGNHGRGVSTSLREPGEILSAFHAARAVCPQVIVEKHVEGDDHRVLVVGGRAAAASRRRPPCVTGDGRRTVAELIAAVNADPRRGAGHARPLTRIDPSDVAAEATLARQGLALDAVPEKGRAVRLRDAANLSAGGDACDVTGRAHPSILAACERAARVVGLDICGVDLVTTDVARPLDETGGAIIEVNAGPGLRMHLAPSSGEARAVGDAVVSMLFPAGNDGRIPIVSVTGTNGKTTVARMIGHVLGAQGLRVGLATTDGIHLGGTELARGDMTGPRSARAILMDPAVEAAVLETARGGIVRGGLGYDWADVGVITNIQRDHIGQDGIRDLDDLLHIKSLVAERVREGGAVVLNAGDPLLAGLAESPSVARPGRRIVLFSLHRTLLSRRHVAAGGLAYHARDGWIAEFGPDGDVPIACIRAIPAAHAGAASFNVLNALAAVASCRALGVPPQVIAEALAGFEANLLNDGRFNILETPRGKVVVDYGHNPAAFEAVGRMASGMRQRKLLGVVGVPGDRDLGVLEEGARTLARFFDVLFVREDADTRGRRRGEIAALMRRSIASENPACRCAVVLDEAAAVRAALETMEQGDLLVCFYDDRQAVRRALAAHGASPAPAAALESPARSRARTARMLPLGQE